MKGKPKHVRKMGEKWVIQEEAVGLFSLFYLSELCWSDNTHYPVIAGFPCVTRKQGNNELVTMSLYSRPAIYVSPGRYYVMK